MLIGQSPGRKYRQDTQTGSRGGSMRTGEFLKERSSLGSPVQTQKKQDVTTLLKKVLSHVPNTDKNNGQVGRWWAHL